MLKKTMFKGSDEKMLKNIIFIYSQSGAFFILSQVDLFARAHSR